VHKSGLAKGNLPVKDELLAVIVAGALVVCWIVLRDQRLKRQGRTSGQDGRGGR
jgi:hypothetical protein